MIASVTLRGLPLLFTALLSLLALTSSAPLASGISPGPDVWLVSNPSTSSLSGPSPFDVSVVEVVGVPGELALPWLLVPDEPYLPGILIADRTLLRRLETAGATVRILDEYVEAEPYYLIRTPPSLSARRLSGLGEILWNRANDYLVRAGRSVKGVGRIEDAAALLGLKLERLEVIERSLVSVRPVSSQIFRTSSSVEDSCINWMVGAVSESDVLDYLNSLTGETAVNLSGGPDTILTRFSFHPQCTLAAQYIYSQFEGMGLSVQYDDYFGVPLYGIGFDGTEGYVVGVGGTILHTVDGGDTWESQASGTDQTLLKLSLVDADSAWACGSVGLCIRTFDGGATWDSLVTGTWYYLYGVKFINALEGWVCGTEGTLLKSSDGGLNWSAQSSGTTARLYDIEFVDSQNGWAVGTSGVIIHTSDGGANWSPQTSGTDYRLHDVCFVSAQEGWAVGYSGTILHTADGGSTWDAQTSGVVVSLQGVCFADSVQGWVVGYGGVVLHTEDGGENWDVQDSGTGSRLFAVTCTDSLSAWAAGTSSIIRTEDEGATWVSLNENVPIRWRNVIATITGTATPDETYIVCGHYDSTSEDPMVRAPGADDNASGTTLVLEAASVLKDFPLLSSVRFICFSGEEQGLIGSDHYAADASVAGDNIAGVLNFDMVGYGTPSIYLIGNNASQWLVDYCIAVRDGYVPSLGITKQINATMRYSDHAPFWDEGYSAFCGIEVDYPTNPYYHSTDDTVGTLTIPFVANVTRLAVASLASLAGIDTTSLSVAQQSLAPPRIALGRSYPNPFNPSTTIPFTLPATNGSANYVLAIFDPAGRMVKILEEGRTGTVVLERRTTWDGTDESGRPVASGVYLCSLSCGAESRSSKIVLLR
ncbi:MAG: M28 family peptidase [Candidatus Eiseniibacteriota bacterium]|nr:MAG: M28 family peptidase [Candidatus Eisenbacteria bacterium]